MFARVVTILAILTITLVTTVTSAHAARMGMSAVPDHSAHVGDMIHSSDNSEFACGGQRPCGSANAETCEVVCAGLTVFLTSPGVEAGHKYGSASHDLPSEASHVSLAPGLNERPPRLRLL